MKQITALFFLFIYLWLFFTALFTPLANLAPNGFIRFQFFQLLFVPEEIFHLVFFGPIGWDRIAILAQAAIPAVAALGVGSFFTQNKVIAFITGLGIYSLFLTVIAFFGLVNNTYLIWTITAFGCAVFIFTFKMPQRPKEWNSLFLLPIAASVLLLLGGMMPPFEYDVVSYHLQGAREIYESGTITFYPHSVYMNMPFGSEMLVVWTMALTKSVWHGAIVGKTLLSLTAIATSIGIYQFCKSQHSQFAGIAGATIYLAAPWTFNMSATGLIDGVVGTYFFFSIWTLLVADAKKDYSSRRDTALSGFLAGCAAACKYPALLFCVFPLAVFVFVKNVANGFSRCVFVTSIFLCFALLAPGLWLGKNAVLTGNPTYPLFYNVFGDRSETWNPEKNERWNKAHSPHNSVSHDWLQFLGKCPFQSPILIPLAVLGVFVANGFSRRVLPISAIILFYLICWTLFTHRIERFWVPLLPLLAVLAGIGAASFESKFWRRTIVVLLAVNVIYTAFIALYTMPGWGTEIETLKKTIYNSGGYESYFNDNPPDGKLLFVGESRVFGYETDLLFNTCFDDCIFEVIVKNKTPEQIREELRRRNISHIIVNWGEIARFRSPGNYGFTDFVQSDVFERLVNSGILSLEAKTPSSNKSCRLYRVL